MVKDFFRWKSLCMSVITGSTGTDLSFFSFATGPATLLFILSPIENCLQQWKGGRVPVKFSGWRSRRWGDETNCTRQEATCRDRETASGESRQTHLYAIVGGVVGCRWPRAAGSRRPVEHQRAATDRMVADLSQPRLGRPLRPALQRGPRQLDATSGRATQGDDCQGAFPQFAADSTMAHGHLRRDVFFLRRQGPPASHWG